MFYIYFQYPLCRYCVHWLSHLKCPSTRFSFNWEATATKSWNIPKPNVQINPQKMSKSEQLKRKKFFMVCSRKYYCVDMCRCQSERDDSPKLTQPLVPCRVISAVQGPDRGPAARQTDQRHGEGEPVSVAVKTISLSFSWPRLSAARRRKQSWQLSWQRFAEIPIRMHVETQCLCSLCKMKYPEGGYPV